MLFKAIFGAHSFQYRAKGGARKVSLISLRSVSILLLLLHVFRNKIACQHNQCVASVNWTELTMEYKNTKSGTKWILLPCKLWRISLERQKLLRWDKVHLKRSFLIFNLTSKVIRLLFWFLQKKPVFHCTSFIDTPCTLENTLRPKKKECSSQAPARIAMWTQF